MTMSEAIILSLFAVVFSNAQLDRLVHDQRSRVYEQRTITLSDQQINDISVDIGTNPGQDGTSAETLPDFELSDEQMSTLSEGFMFHSRDFIIMDIQLGLIVISVALPLGMFFNGMIVRRVVMPIKNLSSLMNDYFSEDENKRSAMIEKLRSMKVSGKNNEIAQLNSAMQRMIDDMTNYIDTVKHEKELESELHIAQARNEAKSQFLSNMSHEIRTPINAILGMNEMILRESSESSTLEYAENIRNAGNTLLGLVNDILDFSKIEAGKMNIIPVDYDLASLLNDLVTMIQTRAEAKGLELAVKVDSSIPDHLHGDEIRIKQAVTNILTNAVKYTEHGTVTISVTYEKYGPENGEDQIGLRFSVADTGIGIKQEDIRKLFSAFERIEEERNRTIEGTGLGMNITQRLLTMMGSRLEVESEYGKGSVFSFTVKQKVVSPEPIGNYEETYRNTIAGRKHYKEKFTAPDANILVTDDTRMNLTVFVSLLKKTMIHIDTAESGDECIALAAKKKYDVIFLDHRMPEKDGIETLQELLAAKDSPNSGTPVICLTANAVSGAKEMYLSA
ncbi:MAG: response regulator, partial [Ruminiclostridium sp.]|nr:response regulator [Ruminiclostridium sp.]